MSADIAYVSSPRRRFRIEASFVATVEAEDPDQACYDLRVTHDGDETDHHFSRCDCTELAYDAAWLPERWRPGAAAIRFAEQVHDDGRGTIVVIADVPDAWWATNRHVALFATGPLPDGRIEVPKSGTIKLEDIYQPCERRRVGSEQWKIDDGGHRQSLVCIARPSGAYAIFAEYFYLVESAGVAAWEIPIEGRAACAALDADGRRIALVMPQIGEPKVGDAHDQATHFDRLEEIRAARKDGAP